VSRGRTDLDAFTDLQGRPLNGVTGKLYARNNAVSLTASVSDVYLVGSDSSFVQFGIFHGNFPGTHLDCSTHPVYMSAPHAFIGYQRTIDQCETLIDLGVLGTLGYRQFGIRQNSDSSLYVRLDSQLLFTTPTGFPASFKPGVVAESNDSCTFMYARADDPVSPYDTLQRIAAGDGVWRFWGFKKDTHDTYFVLNYYELDEPNPGSPAQFLFYGPNNAPGC
jgi:hypothetical protein